MVELSVGALSVVAGSTCEAEYIAASEAANEGVWMKEFISDLGGGTLCVIKISQHNWVIIKMLYRCLRRCLLGWHISRLRFVTPSIGEVSLGPLGNAHNYKPYKQCD